MRTAVLLLVFAEAALACRCKMMSAAQAYPRAAAVVLAVAGKAGQLTLKQAWKMDLPAALEVDSKDPDCPQEFAPGETYVLYLYRTAPGAKWTTRNCVGNKPLAMAQEDLAWLGKRGAAAKVHRVQRADPE